MTSENIPLLLDQQPELLRIQELAEQLAVALAQNAPIDLDDAPEHLFDGFNLQLVLAMASAAHREGIEPDWRGSSPHLRKAAAVLGLYTETTVTEPDP